MVISTFVKERVALLRCVFVFLFFLSPLLSNVKGSPACLSTARHRYVFSASECTTRQACIDSSSWASRGGCGMKVCVSLSGEVGKALPKM